MVLKFEKYTLFPALIIAIFSIVYINFFTPKYAMALDCTNPEYARSNESYCRNQLNQYLEEEARLLKELEQQSKKSANYASEVKRLTTEISALKTKIKARENSIALLKNDINNKKSTINTLTNKIDREKESLAQLLRKERMINDRDIISLILSKDNISDVYGDIEAFSSIKKGIQESISEIRNMKDLTEAEKLALEKKKDEETNAKYELENTQKRTAQVEGDKKRLLAESKNQETALAKIAAEKKAQAEKIRNALIKFQGSGISSKSISFGEAYDYAKKASAKTGVRTALILAIMQQETGFGNNVGGCNLRNAETGDGIYVKSGNPSIRNMVPGNFDNFKKITSSLGMDWKTTPISCVYIQPNGTPYGYGGAMGYTQFIPNTWMDVEARVRSYLKISTANPWNPEHAVMATAIFLQDKGASSQLYTDEYNSACRYYGSCSSYASSVMKKASNIQLDIDKLEDL